MFLQAGPKIDLSQSLNLIYLVLSCGFIDLARVQDHYPTHPQNTTACMPMHYTDYLCADNIYYVKLHTHTASIFIPLRP